MEQVKPPKGIYKPKGLVETTDEYLRRGGKIRHIPMGVSGKSSEEQRRGFKPLNFSRQSLPRCLPMS